MFLIELVRDYFTFREIISEFSVNFRKIWKSTENLGEMIWTNFVKNNLLENCLQTFGEFSEYFHFTTYELFT